jgi:hypothetical protein
LHFCPTHTSGLSNAPALSNSAYAASYH